MRNFLFGPLVRLFPVGCCVLALQRTILTELKPFGVVVQIVLALVVAAGAGAGPERGALAGFVLGTMLDLAAGTPLGLTAMVYGLAGFVAGYVLTLTPTPQWWLAAIFAGIGAAVGELVLPIAKMLIGQDGWFTTDLFVIVPVVAGFAMLMAPLFVPLGRWCVCVKRSKWKAIPE